MPVLKNNGSSIRYFEDDRCVQGMVVCAPTVSKKAPEGAFFLKRWIFYLAINLTDSDPFYNFYYGKKLKILSLKTTTKQAATINHCKRSNFLST